MLGSWQDVPLYSDGHWQISTPVASGGECVGISTAASREASSNLNERHRLIEHQIYIFFLISIFEIIALTDKIISVPKFACRK